LGSKEIAEIYARLSEVEGHSGAMEKATACRFDEITQDLGRLQSNSETQKKVMAQELARIEVETHSAVDRAQTQIDSLRQQTSDMHTSLTAIHEHSSTLTATLKNMMQSFTDMRFELPNTIDNCIDNWMRVKAGGQNGTVSAAELQPWKSSTSLLPLSLPPPLQVSPPPPAPTTPTNAVAPETNTSSTHPPLRTPAPNPASAPHSPNDSYQGFMAPYMQHSEAMRDLNDNLDNGGTGGMEVDEGDLNVDGAAGIEQVDQEPTGLERMSIPADVVEQGGRMEPTAQAERASTEQAVQESTPELSGAESVPASTSAIAETGAIVTDEDMPQTQEGTSGSLSHAPPVEEPNVSQPLTPGQSQRTPPSTPPTYIRDHSVPAPSGLLVSNDIGVLPPSSQSSLASPSPQPNYRLLNRPRAGTVAVSWRSIRALTSATFT